MPTPLPPLLIPSGELTKLLKMAIEIVDFPIKHGGSFHGKMLVHQRVTSSDATSDGGIMLACVAKCLLMNTYE